MKPTTSNGGTLGVWRADDPCMRHAGWPLRLPALLSSRYSTTPSRLTTTTTHYANRVRHEKGTRRFFSPPQYAVFSVHNSALSHVIYSVRLFHSAPSTSSPHSPSNSSSYPLAKSRTQLRVYLTDLIYYRKPAPSLDVLQSYHGCHAFHLHSTDSFNLLIEYAIHCGSYHVAQTLFNEMHRAGYLGNVGTRKLRTRWLVQRGWWQRAWDQATSNADTSSPNVLPAPLPLPVWVELMMPKALRWEKDPYMPSTFSRNAPLSQEDRLWLLLRNAPRSPQGDTIHPAATKYIIQAFLRLDKPDIAWKLAVSYLANLPRELGHHTLRRCMAIIHLFLRPTGVRGLAQFHDRRRAATTLMALHPRLSPSADTLYFLMGNIRGAAKAALHSVRLLESWKRRWGQGVEDDLVRRRIASFALQEGRLDIVKRMLRRHKQTDLVHNTTRRQRLRKPAPKRRKHAYFFRGLVWRLRGVLLKNDSFVHRLRRTRHSILAQRRERNRL